MNEPFVSSPEPELSPLPDPDESSSDGFVTFTAAGTICCFESKTGTAGATGATTNKKMPLDQNALEISSDKDATGGR